MKAYQLKVTIKKSKPPIWRRCIVPGEISFSQLTHILRKVIGWSGYHLSEYSFNGLKIKLVENASEDDWMWDYEVLDSSEYLIDDFFSAAKSFSYVYDFGDWWDHEVKIEKIIEDYENNYPIVTKYKGITPPEDCGGIYGYYQMMDTLSDPKNPEYEEMKEWYGDDSEYEYNLEAVNNRLSAMTVTNKKIKPISERELDEKYLGSGRMPLDKVKGKGMPVSVLGNGKTKYEKEFKKFSGIMDSFFDELSKTPQYKDQIKQLLSKGIEPVPNFTYDFEKWNSVQIVTSRNKIQDYLLNLREKDVDNFSKYLQLSALSNDTKLSKIKKLIAYLSSNPEYYLYLFDSLSLPVLFDIFDGKEDELGFDDFAPDCVADAIQIGAMIGLFQVKDKGKTCQLALAEDAKGIVDSIRKVDSKKVYEQLEDFDKNVGAIVRNYGFIEVDSALDILRGIKGKHPESTKELKKMLYWHARMMNMAETGYNMLTNEAYIIFPGFHGDKIAAYRNEHDIDNILEYRQLDFNDPGVYSNNIADSYYCWENLAYVLRNEAGLSEEEESMYLIDLFFDVCNGETAAGLYDKVKHDYPTDNPFVLSMYWHSTFACCAETGLPHLKGYSRYEYQEKLGRYPEDLPMGENLPKGKKARIDEELKYLTDEEQWDLYTLQLVECLEGEKDKCCGIIDKLLDRYPDNKYLLAYLPDVLTALDQKARAKEVLEKLLMMDHSLKKQIKTMMKLIDSGKKMPYFEDGPFTDDYLSDDFYVPQDPVVRQHPKVGRNDPCPCGSGKKFKKCCMGKGIYD